GGEVLGPNGGQPAAHLDRRRARSVDETKRSQALARDAVPVPQAGAEALHAIASFACRTATAIGVVPSAQARAKMSRSLVRMFASRSASGGNLGSRRPGMAARSSAPQRTPPAIVTKTGANKKTRRASHSG